MSNLNVPYLHPVPHKLRNGATLIIQGNINGKKRFDINLTLGKFGEDDVALHISSRIDEKAVVFNSFLDGKWMKKELRHKFEFKNEEGFEYRIRVGESEYTIFLNGDEIMSFPFNHPVELVEYIAITGDVALGEVLWANA